MINFEQDAFKDSKSRNCKIILVALFIPLLVSSIYLNYYTEFVLGRRFVGKGQ